MNKPIINVQVFKTFIIGLFYISHSLDAHPEAVIGLLSSTVVIDEKPDNQVVKMTD